MGNGQELAHVNRLRVAPVDPMQEDLTNSHLLPHSQEIVLDFERLRAAIDMAVRTFARRYHRVPLKRLQPPSGDGPDIFYSTTLQATVDRFLKGQPLESLTEYPIGQCTTITHAAWRLIQDGSILPPTEGFAWLRTFVSLGGVFRVIWGGCRRQYFQTALQAGSYYFDISNDTVDPEHPQIDHTFLDASNFHEIRSYAEYMEIKSEYHQVDIYANDCLPEVFPYYPLIVCSRHTGRLAIDTSQYMAELNIDTRFQTIMDALEMGSLGAPLPETAERQIAGTIDTIQGGSQSTNWLIFRVTDKEEKLNIFRRAASLNPAEHAARLHLIKRLCSFLNYIWNRRKS